MRIVLVRLSALGDIVHTWPLADAIRRRRPKAHLTWVVEAPLVPLVEGHPSVDAVITTRTRRWRSAPFAAQTRAEVAALKGRFSELAPDLAIDAQGTVKSAMVARWTGARRRVGLARPWRRELAAGLAYSETLPGSSSDPHIVATNVSLVDAVGEGALVPPRHPDGRWLLDAGVDGVDETWGRPYAVLLPGAGQPDKILPVDTLAAVAHHLEDRGIDTVVVWGPSERDRAREVVAAGGDMTHLAPPTDLLQLTVVLGSAAVVVGGDTGPVHLAASLGVPTVGVFLTTDAHRNAPLGDRTAVVSGAAPSRGISGSATTGKDRNLSPDEIVDALTGLLGSRN